MENYLLHHTGVLSWRGKSIWIMHEHGFSFIRLYWYMDDENVIYLSEFTVEESQRRKGYGRDLLQFAEEKARELNCSKILLQVERDSWIHKWYMRCGYVRCFSNDENNDNLIWLCKYRNKIMSCQKKK